MWYELDLTTNEANRLQVQAAKQGTTVETLVSKLARQHIMLGENLGARVAMGPDSLDTRHHNPGGRMDATVSAAISQAEAAANPEP